MFLIIRKITNAFRDKYSYILATIYFLLIFNIYIIIRPGLTLFEYGLFSFLYPNGFSADDYQSFFFMNWVWIKQSFMLLVSTFLSSFILKRVFIIKNNLSVVILSTILYLLLSPTLILLLSAELKVAIWIFIELTLLFISSLFFLSYGKRLSSQGLIKSVEIKHAVLVGTLSLVFLSFVANPIAELLLIGSAASANFLDWIIEVLLVDLIPLVVWIFGSIILSINLFKNPKFGFGYKINNSKEFIIHSTLFYGLWMLTFSMSLPSFYMPLPFQIPQGNLGMFLDQYAILILVLLPVLFFYLSSKIYLSRKRT